MSTSAGLLPFVQFDFPGRLGPDDGRYLVRSDSGEVEHVLVVGGVEGLAATRRGRRRRGRARDADDSTPAVPLTRVTVIRPRGYASADEAKGWMDELTGSQEEMDALVAEGLRVVNRALHTHHVAAQDPFGGGASETAALATRVGFGTGDELADGRWTEAALVPPQPGPRRRAEALRPQERLAAELGRREATAACETLLLRARADLDGERAREAALQLRVGLEALLAEVTADAPAPAGAGAALASDQLTRQAADLEALATRRAITGEAANEALGGELSTARAAEVEETLAICERVLRRRRVLAS